MTLILAVQAVVFAAWVFVAFRFLFRLRAVAVRASGRPFPGLDATLDAFRAGAADPAFAADRRRLLILTAALLILSAAPAILRL